MPYALPEDAKVTIRDLIKENWNHQTVSDFENNHSDFTWVIDDHFKTRWIHTGWHSDSNPYPQVTISTKRDDPGSPTGWNGIDATGRGPTAWMDGRLQVDTWVPDDGDRTGDINAKKYAYQLAVRVQLIASEFATGHKHFHRLGTGEERELPDPDETPIGARYRIPVFYGWHKSPR